jgi:CDP-diacylglycerol--glycerol-3-phosphate 3-phosphatidyltransferase/cardiolipin synthase
MDSSYTQLTLATKVTITRILGIPVFVLLMIYYFISLERGEANEAYRYAALGLFITIIATDALDGYLARSRGEISKLGALLDPLADKLLVLSSLILLTRPNFTEFQPQLPVWFTVTLISRDGFLVLGYFVIYAVAHKVEVKPTWAGKASTFLVAITVGLVLVKAPTLLLNIFLGMSAACVVTSWWQYLRAGLKQMHHPVTNDAVVSDGND